MAPVHARRPRLVDIASQRPVPGHELHWKTKRGNGRDILLFSCSHSRNTYLRLLYTALRQHLCDLQLFCPRE
ncbi:hypothetical protein D3C71_1728160 [compost metagenome]